MTGIVACYVRQGYLSRIKILTINFTGKYGLILMTECAVAGSTETVKLFGGTVVVAIVLQNDRASTPGADKLDYKKFLIQPARQRPDGR